jgi:hypothetical protein
MLETVSIGNSSKLLSFVFYSVPLVTRIQRMIAGRWIRFFKLIDIGSVSLRALKPRIWRVAFEGVRNSCDRFHRTYNNRYRPQPQDVFGQLKLRVIPPDRLSAVSVISELVRSGCVTSPLTTASAFPTAYSTSIECPCAAPSCVCTCSTTAAVSSPTECASVQTSFEFFIQRG